MYSTTPKLNIYPEEVNLLNSCLLTRVDQLLYSLEMLVRENGRAERIILYHNVLKKVDSCFVSYPSLWQELRGIEPEIIPTSRLEVGEIRFLVRLMNGKDALGFIHSTTLSCYEECISKDEILCFENIAQTEGLLDSVSFSSEIKIETFPLISY